MVVSAGNKKKQSLILLSMEVLPSASTLHFILLIYKGNDSCSVKLDCTWIYSFLFTRIEI